MWGRGMAHRNNTDFSLLCDSPVRGHCSLLDAISGDLAQQLHSLLSINICLCLHGSSL